VPLRWKSLFVLYPFAEVKIMVAAIRLMKVLLSAVLAAGAALPLAPAQPAAANVVGIDVIACPNGISILVLEEDTTQPAPQVDWSTFDGRGVRAGVIGEITDSDLPEGKTGRQFVYWSDVSLTAGVTGTVIARGQRNEAYARFTVDGDCPPLGSVRGSAFEDLNRNGVRDAGEASIGTASWKLTAGGDWFICGYVGGDSTFGPTVKPGTYTVIPIAQPGWAATTPPRTALVKQLGMAALNNDIGFVRVAGSSGQYCGQYAPAISPVAPLPAAHAPTDVLAEYGVFNTLLSALNSTGLAGALNGPGPYTLIAPADAAFASLSPATQRRLASNPQALAELLKCHVIIGNIDIGSLGPRAKAFPTLGARKVMLQVRNGQLLVNGVMVGEVIPTRNGQIWVPSRVLFVR
jgi:uncharacterized surface protein with fasciclin (FAS1) repeats